ncbi:MAG TPA: tail fiber domain-containing protein [Steroidobacteraceae bacterium]|nr:tail fiber domain-containing protein [Steroidobacteraceae bacterium]
MKRIALAISVLTVSTMAAGAADLPVKAPAVQPALTPQASGYIEVYTGGSWLEDTIAANALFFTPGATKFNGWPIGGAGRGNWWATNDFSVQMDAQAEGTQYIVPPDLVGPGFSAKFSTLSYLVGGHANFRNSQTGLIGVFGAIGDASGNITTDTLFTTSRGVRHASGGLEGQYYWNALTLYGQVGYDASLDMGNTASVDDVHAWFVRGTARYFFMPNFMVEGTAQYSKGAVGFTSFGLATPDTGFDMWRASLKAEWRPWTMPFSIFGKYEYNQTNYAQNTVRFTPNERIAENRVMGGIRFYLGQNTLLANDRTGATLDILDTLGGPTSPLTFGGQARVVFVSDARLKRDIVLVGRLDNGLGLYRYRYLWSDAEYVGVMAQEVALIQPKAVVHGFDGYLRVNYGLLGVPFRTLTEWQAQNKAEHLGDIAANPI